MTKYCEWNFSSERSWWFADVSTCRSIASTTAEKDLLNVRFKIIFFVILHGAIGSLDSRL